MVFPVRDGKILLGMKKRGFAPGKINGFGGKINKGETVPEAAVRELFEEIGIEVTLDELKKVGELKFFFPHMTEENWDHHIHVFLIDSWRGEPAESEEMTCDWYDIDKIPFDKMWDDDRHWMPMVLDGKRVRGNIFYGEDNATVESHEIVQN